MTFNSFDENMAIPCQLSKVKSTGAAVFFASYKRQLRMRHLVILVIRWNRDEEKDEIKLKGW